MAAWKKMLRAKWVTFLPSDPRHHLNQTSDWVSYVQSRWSEWKERKHFISWRTLTPLQQGSSVAPCALLFQGLSDDMGIYGQVKEYNKWNQHMWSKVPKKVTARNDTPQGPVALVRQDKPFRPAFSQAVSSTSMEDLSFRMSQPSEVLLRQDTFHQIHLVS